MSVSRTPNDVEREYMREIGKRLRTARVNRGLTIADVAEQSDGTWPPSVIASYEGGRRNATLGRLKRLADFYGTSIHALIPADDPDAERARIRSDAAIEVLSGVIGVLQMERQACVQARRTLEVAS